MINCYHLNDNIIPHNVVRILDDIRWIIKGKTPSIIDTEGLMILASNLKALPASICSYGYEEYSWNITRLRNSKIEESIEGCLAYSTGKDVKNFLIIKKFLDRIYEIDRDSWWFGVKLIFNLNDDEKLVVAEFLENLISALLYREKRQETFGL